MLAYNFSLFVFLNDKAYAYYCFYVITIAIYNLAVNGVGSTYIWGSNSWINSHIYGVSTSLAFLAAAVFIRVFLNLKEYGGVVYWLSNIAISAWTLIIVLMFLPYQNWVYFVADLNGYISCMIGLGISSYLWAKGDKSAKYLTIAWVTLMASTFNLLLGLANVVTYRPWMQEIQNIAFIIEVILLSMALAERVNREREQRIRAQAESLQLSLEARAARESQVAAQARALLLEKESKERLEKQVDIKTKELRSALTELELVNIELSKLSSTDPLTHLLNRRTLDTKFREALAKEHSRNGRISLLMLDIDHFKQINDYYGHQAGDRCLIALGKLLSDLISPDKGLVARYGGEEFCIVLLGDYTERVDEIAENIRHATEQYQLEFDGEIISLTISIGCYTTTVVPELTTEQLVKKADQALYLAKRNGRNRVEHSS